MADTIPTTFTVPLVEYTRLAAERDRYKARLAEAERKIQDALKCANGRWCEWGSRAESVRDILESTTDSADVVPCRTCGGSGAVDAPTSADDPSCPDCDGEGNIAVCEHCGRADAFDGMWHKSHCPTLNHPIQKPYPPMTGSGDGEGNAPKNSR